MAEDTKKKPSRLARAWRSLTRERVLAEMGPLYLARSPWPHMLIGWALAAVAIYMILSARPLFPLEDTEALGIWFSPGFLIALAVVIGLLFSIRFKFGGKGGFLFSTLLLAAMPFAAYYMVEFLNGYEAYEREPEIVFLNIVAYALVYLFFLVVFGNYRWAVVFGTGLLYVFAVTCYFVLQFRGTPFVPLDIFSGGTAANVADNYVFEITPRWAIVTVQAGLLMGVGYQLGRAHLRRMRWKVTMRALAIFVVLGAVSAFFSGSYLTAHGFAISYWNQQQSYEKYGDWLAFCLNLRNVYPERPENYSADEVSNIVGGLLIDDGISPEGDKAYNMLTGENDYAPTEKQPNIIMIMNESFADLQSVGDGFKTNKEVLPFFNSLKENTVRGTLQVSVSGGGTACTEYEVLTGNAQRFLPSGAVAYSANIHSSTPSMAWTLREQGYNTSAFHPYYISGWNREKAYTYLGFEDLTFIEDILPENILEMDSLSRMEAVEKIDEDDGDVYNRDYMSDHYDYEIIQDLFEARNTANPFFLFNVTIQNHGGYADGFENFKESIEITDMDGDYPQAERYLSLMRASDDAFKELVEYFEDIDEPTIIVMFGDHQPSVDEGFYEELFGVDNLDELSIPEMQSRYQTPFVIWANYDIPEKDVGLISANYLSTLVMEVAGVEMTPYNRYLASLYERVPTVSNLGFTDADGEAAYYLNGTAYEDLIDDYQCVAYNNLLDYSHRDWGLFTLDGEALPDVQPAKDGDGSSLLSRIFGRD